MQTKASLFTIATLAASLTAGLAQITTVNYGAYPGARDVVDASNVAIPIGNEVRIGYWSGAVDVAAAASAGDLALLQSAWHQFDTAVMGETFSLPGYFAASGDKNDPTFDNQKIYLWTFKTTGDVAPTLDLSNVQQYGIFSSTATEWKFPAHDALQTSTTISTAQVDQALWGSIVGAPDTGHLQLAAVPEPQAYALAIGLGLLGFAVWRRSAPQASLSSAAA